MIKMKFKIILVVLAVSSFSLSLAFEKPRHRGVCGEHYQLNETISCDKLYGIFHKCVGIFIEVALDTVNPFQLCTDYQAYQSYRNLTLFLNLLKTSHDPTNRNVTCSDEYMNKNSMGVISKIVALSTSLWENANCDDCYANTTSVIQNFSDHTNQFLSLRDKYKYCTRDKQNASMICSACEETYSQMNIIFNHHKEKSGLICFDLEDIMNKTRLEWSTVFKCCKDKRDSLTAFYSLFSTIFALALIFYSSVYCVGSRNSVVDPHPIDARQITPNVTNGASSAPAPTSSSSSSSASSAAAAAIVQRKEKKKSTKVLSLNNDDSDDDDDEPIIGNSANNNLIHLND